VVHVYTWDRKQTSSNECCVFVFGILILVRAWCRMAVRNVTTAVKSLKTGSLSNKADGSSVISSTHWSHVSSLDAGSFGCDNLIVDLVW
jgi:hypothetical protein